MDEPLTDHEHTDGHGHGHSPERGWFAGLRYLKMVRRFWRSDVNESVVEMVAPAAGEHVLDIGAGLGAASMLAIHRVGTGTVTAVDPLPFMRSGMRLRKLWPGRRKHFEVAEGTAESLPVKDASIDAAWATNALHHFDDIDAAAKEIARVLRPGGRVVFVEEQFTDPAHPSHEKFGGGSDDESKHRFHAVDLERVSAVMDAAGFDVTQAEDTLVAGVPAKVIRLSRR